MTDRPILSTDRRPAARSRWTVSGERLRHNLALIHQHADCGVCAVVKADAYGHGAAAVADALFADDAGKLPSAMAVADLEEAASLPSHDAPVMCLRPIELAWSLDRGHTAHIDRAIREGTWLSVIGTTAAGDVARRARTLGTRANVQVMLDTGMSREACDPRDFVDVVESVIAAPELRLVALGTHFTDGEASEEAFSDDQVWLFNEALSQLEPRLPARVHRHVANSGGALSGHGGLGGFDLVRPGIALYGIDPKRPDGPALDDAGLRPVGRWTAPLWSAREIPAGATVGYNRAWRAPVQTRVGLVPVGYADGYRRELSNRGVIRVDRPDGPPAFCPVIGRVSMDYVTIDLGPAPWVRPGDDVIVVDDDPTSPCSAAAIAGLCGTIAYEILCGIGRRVTRVMA